MAHASADGQLSQIECRYMVRTATKVVAASDASAAGRALSDEVCSGTADDVQIQLAIDAIA